MIEKTASSSATDKLLTGILVLLVVIFAIEVATIIILETAPESSIGNIILSFIRQLCRTI